MKLWSEDGNGELWLDNPVVAIANPRKRKKGMPAGLKRYWASKRGARSNPRPRRAPRRARATRTYYRARRNPGGRWLSGLNFTTIGGVAAGFAAPRFVMAQVAKFMPDAVLGNPVGFWLVKAASALLPGFIVKNFRKDFGQYMMIGGGVSLVLDAVSAYAPGFLSGVGSQPLLGGMGYYSAGMVASGPGVQTLPTRLGMYSGRNAYPPARRQTNILATAPSRLNPAARF